MMWKRQNFPLKMESFDLLNAQTLALLRGLPPGALRRDLDQAHEGLHGKLLAVQAASTPYTTNQNSIWGICKTWPPTFNVLCTPLAQDRIGNLWQPNHFPKVPLHTLQKIHYTFYIAVPFCFRVNNIHNVIAHKWLYKVTYNCMFFATRKETIHIAGLKFMTCPS